MKLRDYQQRTLDAIAEHDTGRTLVIAPTGAGKGTMATELLALAHESRTSALFVVHRREIIGDLIRRLKARGVDAGPHNHSTAFVRVISAQAALRAKLPHAELLIIDEAHHYAADEWGSILERVAARRVVGFTATPERADGRSLADIFEDVIEAVSYRELLARGILVPCRVLRPRAELSGGDIAQEPVNAYLRHGRDEIAIFFMPTVDHAKQAHLALTQAGVKAGIVHAKTSKSQRDRTMAALEAGDLRVVVNVGVLTEGVDVPHVTCIVLARSCGHESIYVQIVGRVLRSCRGKTEATLIDLVGASHRHGLPGSDRRIMFEPSAELRLRDVQTSAQNADDRGPVRVLDVELVEARAAQDLSDSGDTDRRFGTRRALQRPAAREGRTPAFLFQEKGYWLIGWSDDGERCKLSLATRDKDVAKEMLSLFRKSGWNAVNASAQARRCANCSIMFDEDAQMWLLERFDNSRQRDVLVKTYAGNREEAEGVLALHRTGAQKEAERAIELLRKRARDRSRSGTVEAAPAQYRGAKLMGQLAGLLVALERSRDGSTDVWGAHTPADLAQHLRRKESDVLRALEALEDQGVAVRCGDDLFCSRDAWSKHQTNTAAKEERHRDQQYRRGESPHPGVHLKTRKLATGISYRAVYTDPSTGKDVFEKLSEHDARSFKTRTAWAVAKAKQLAEAKP